MNRFYVAIVLLCVATVRAGQVGSGRGSAGIYYGGTYGRSGHNTQTGTSDSGRYGHGRSVTWTGGRGGNQPGYDSNQNNNPGTRYSNGYPVADYPHVPTFPGSNGGNRPGNIGVDPWISPLNSGNRAPGNNRYPAIIDPSGNQPNAYRPNGNVPGGILYQPGGNRPNGNGNQPSGNRYRPGGNRPNGNQYRPGGYRPNGNQYRPGGNRPNRNQYRPDGNRPNRNQYRPGGDRPNRNQPGYSDPWIGTSNTGKQDIDGICRVSFPGYGNCPIVDSLQQYCTSAVRHPTSQVRDYMRRLFQTCVIPGVTSEGSNCQSMGKAIGEYLFEDFPGKNCIYQGHSVCPVRNVVNGYSVNDLPYGQFNDNAQKAFSHVTRDYC